jgi:hypothetical protein
MVKSFVVIRAKTNMPVAIVQLFPVAEKTGLISDRHVRLVGLLTATGYSELLRLVTFFDRETGKISEFLTNNRTFPVNTICDLYKRRWQAELFFKRIR